MSNTPIDNLLRLAGEEYSQDVLAALAQAWDEGQRAGARTTARHEVSYPANPYKPVRYP